MRYCYYRRCLYCGKRFRSRKTGGSVVCRRCYAGASAVHCCPEVFMVGPAGIEARRSRLWSDSTFTRRGAKC